MRISESIGINAFDYDLPDNRIAKYPLKSREKSKLLFYERGEIKSHLFEDLPDILSNDHHLVFNDTRVIQARLLFRKTSGAVIEIFLLEPFNPADYILAFQESTSTVWKCMIGNAKKWKTGALHKQISSGTIKTDLHAEITGQDGRYKLITFTWNNPEVCFSQIILSAGLTPLPPYLNREPEGIDKVRYQTVYSDYEGSVAAPTAGLHFTERIIEKLVKKNITASKLTLHVGAGTFIPVKEQNAMDHNMHTEHFVVNRKCLRMMMKPGKKIIAVGTTSLRTLESIYWLGVKIRTDNNFNKCSNHLDQWEYKMLNIDLSRSEAFQTILDYLDKNNLDHFKGSTKIMIVPGYEFMTTDGIITNFHQPKSTLLLLIAAFIGDEWEKTYKFALKNNYRFLSYGDSSLLIR